MKNAIIVALLLSTLGFFVSTTCKGIVVSDLKEEKEGLQRKTALLEKPAVFSINGDIFVVIKRLADMKETLISINGSCPVKAWNYSIQNFTGIYRLPEDIKAYSEVTLLIEDKHCPDGTKKMFPVEVDLEDITFTRIYEKNIRNQEVLNGLPTTHNDVELRQENGNSYVFLKSPGGEEDYYSYKCN